MALIKNTPMKTIFKTIWQRHVAAPLQALGSSWRLQLSQPHWLDRRARVLHHDLNWCLRLNRHSASRPVAQFFKGISRLGDSAFWVSMGVVTAVLVGPKGWAQLGWYALCSNGGTQLYRYLKKTTVRPRPYQVHQAICLGERPLDHFSFPSGHTLHAVMITMLLGMLAPSLLWLMVPFTLLVALSRVVLGLHYPSDVLAGATLGALVAGLAIGIGQLWF